MVRVSAFTRQTRAYEPDDPELRRKRIKKLKLGELERVPPEQAELHRAMLGALPEAVFDRDFMPKLRDLLTQYTGMDIDLWLHSVRTMSRSELRGLMPGTTFIAVVGLSPLTEKVLLELDLRFVYRVVDRLLGGSGMVADIHRPLTEIEQGVFSYVVLKVLSLFYGGVVNPDQIAIRLEDMRHDLKSTADVIRYESNWVVLSWKMNFDLDVGFVRVLAPSGLARRVLHQEQPVDAASISRRHDCVRKRMGRLEGVTVEAAVEIGRIELHAPDIEALDPGDIVLLERTAVRLEDGRPMGDASMIIGMGHRAVVRGLLSVQGNPEQSVFEVTKIEIKETPRAHDPQLNHGEPANPEDVIAEYEDPHPEDEANDGTPSRDDVDDEDFGLDDENEGDGEEYDDEYGAPDASQAYDEGEEAPAPSQQYAAADDNLAESEPILGDIPISVVVELGRVQLTADEVIRLRAGQIIELGRSPSDAVDLVVAGKLLAKGELVEIDGALGVKLLQLVKES